MAFLLEFWKKDGPNGEAVALNHRVTAWQILPTVERFRTPEHVYITLGHSDPKRGEWIIWVRPGYTSPTSPAVGPLTVILSPS